MKYAIISDIHGNIHAFNAALADAKDQGVDRYLLLGDYTTCFPWGNTVANTIRSLKQATVIRGNGEDYFINHQNNQFNINNEQFKPVYWDYRSLTPQNLEYLAGLPEAASIIDDDSGSKIHLIHALDLFYPSKIECFSPRDFRIMMTKAPFSHAEYLLRTQEAVLSCPETIEKINALPNGIYLFGHNHLQFHMAYDGKLFINPGSCGQALDWDTTAAYTLLTCTADGCWIVDERRVDYDLNIVAEGLDTSGFTDYAPMWSKIFKMELTEGKNYMFPFVLYLMETGKALKQTDFPVSKEVWDAAIETWDPERI
ncbi:MAG: metallophosphatase family protein [Defluviitaleaceae bacterium]|nr:metallophosphatase family protein [Defluviitaleaceae bacterium]